jgi:hypothetical protein
VLPPFPAKPQSDLSEADLHRLIEDQVGEDVEIGYKVALETSCQEFARDVSAFANTKGGRGRDTHQSGRYPWVRWRGRDRTDRPDFGAGAILGVAHE